MNKASNSELASRSGTSNVTQPSAVDTEKQPLPGRTPDVDSDRQDPPPARSGAAGEKGETPTEAGDRSNPVNHVGHIPPPVTQNKE